MVVDALSRVPTLVEKGEFKELITVQQGWLTEVHDSYSNDQEVKGIIKGIARGDPTFDGYQYHKGLLKYGKKFYIGSSEELGNKVIWKFHYSPMGGHSDQEITYK